MSENQVMYSSLAPVVGKASLTGNPLSTHGRVVLLTGNSLCHNPRVMKEALALQDAGFRVTVLGAWTDSELRQRDTELLANSPIHFRAVLDKTSQPRNWTIARLKVKAGNWLKRWYRMESHWQLGYTPNPLLDAARKETADLFIAHSESGLWVASRLMASGRRVGVDMEDWFSEDLLPSARAQRPLRLLRALEGELLRKSIHSTTTSRAMAQAMAQEYSSREPAVVYNAFPWKERNALDGKLTDRGSRSVPSLHWYSQTLGFGRGIEDLIQALPNVSHPVEIHLRGKPAAGFEAWLHAQLPEKWRSRVILHPLVSNGELLSRIAEHDIGLAAEQPYCRSRDLTITNKILHYLLGGLAVVASDTSGQREVAETSKGAVWTYPPGMPHGLAAHLNCLLSNPSALEASRKMSLLRAERAFSWEQSAGVLVDSVRNAISAPKLGDSGGGCR